MMPPEVPSPNCPHELLPQHLTRPLSRMPQVLWVLTAIAASVLFAGIAVTGTGALLLSYVPSPNWPTLLYPQHIPLPLSNIAHDERPPVDSPTAVRPGGRGIWVGYPTS